MAIEPLPSRRDDVDRRPPRPVAGDVDRILASLGAPPAPVLSVLAEKWAEIVGPVATEHCRPGSLVDGRLRIEVADSTWASQIKWQRAELIGRVAEFVGTGVVRTMDVQVSPRW